MSLIAELCEGCDRQNCRILMDSGGVTTCMAWAPEHDRNGRLLSRDPNTTTTGARCTTCSKEWSVVYRSGEPPEIRLHGT